MHTPPSSPSRSSYYYFGAVALLAMTAATAQVGIDASGSYREEVKSCQSGKTQQDKATCLTEARAAHADPQRRAASAPDEALKANAMVRCDALAVQEKAACRARIMGQGSSSGSVAGGGILREFSSTEVVPAPAPAASAAP